MLVLTRRIGESIVIDDHVRVKIVDICRGRVRIAIEAPPHIPVDREEVYERMLAEGVIRSPTPATA